MVKSRLIVAVSDRGRGRKTAVMPQHITVGPPVWGKLSESIDAASFLVPKIT